MKLFKLKKKQTTSEERVQLAQNKITSSLNMFHSINKDIEEANATLEEVIVEDKQKIKNIRLNLEKAESELQANKGLQEQLKNFLK